MAVKRMRLSPFVMRKIRVKDFKWDKCPLYADINKNWQIVYAFKNSEKL